MICGFTETPKVPKGYVTFPKGEGGPEGDSKLCYRDVTSPINQEDYNALDSSGGRNTGTHVESWIDNPYFLHRKQTEIKSDTCIKKYFDCLESCFLM